MNTAKLIEQLTVAILASAITIPTIQRVKGWLKSDRMVEFTSVVTAFVVGFVFSIYYVGFNTIDSAVVGFFSIIGAENIYKLFHDKLKTFKDVAIVDGMIGTEEREEVGEVG